MYYPKISDISVPSTSSLVRTPIVYGQEIITIVNVLLYPLQAIMASFVASVSKGLITQDTVIIASPSAQLKKKLILIIAVLMLMMT